VVGGTVGEGGGTFERGGLSSMHVSQKLCASPSLPRRANASLILPRQGITSKSRAAPRSARMRGGEAGTLSARGTGRRWTLHP
jgi:hypothetical protein